MWCCISASTAMWSGCLNNALDGVAASSQENKTDVVLHFGMHGTVEELRERLGENMMATGNLSLALDVNLLNPYAQGVMPPATPSFNPAFAGGWGLRSSMHV